MSEPIKFSQFIADFGGGALDDELTAALAEVAESAQLLDLAGSLDLKLKLSIPKKTTGGLIVDASVTAKPPKQSRAAFFFVAEDGALSRRDPNQPQIPGTEDPKESTSDV